MPQGKLLGTCLASLAAIGRPQDGPRRPQVCPKHPQTRPGWPQTAPGWPKRLPRAPLDAPRTTQSIPKRCPPTAHRHLRGKRSPPSPGLASQAKSERQCEITENIRNILGKASGTLGNTRSSSHINITDDGTKVSISTWAKQPKRSSTQIHPYYG